MSDREHLEIRERLIAVETQLAELPRVRERTHELVNCTQRLITASEEATDTRNAIKEELKVLANKANESALASARAETQLGATLALHIEQCKTDKAELKTLFAGQHVEQQRMHSENRAELSETRSQLVRLEVRLAMYAGGAAMLAVILPHLFELAEKLIH